MGWLKELMAGSPTPVKGYGELARQVLAQPEWPEDTQPKPRSLSALFSKLDRGIELEWLLDRPAVQLALSRTLECSVDVLRTGMDRFAPKPETLLRQIRLDDLPFARPFEFVDEPLPPGIPKALTTPATWQRHWWVAPAGSGRTLVGQWLAARGRAQFIQARSWEEAAQRMADGCPVYVELERGTVPNSLSHLPTTAPLCVASAHGPPPCHGPTSCRTDGLQWTLIPEVQWAEQLLPLLRWIEARLPVDGSFSAEAAHQWMGPLVDRGLLPSFGAIVGAAGVLDEVGMHRLGSRSIEQLVAEQVTQKLRMASATGSSEAQWLQDHGYDVVVRLAQQVLTHTDSPWAQARDEDEWIALVPEEYRQSIDAQWVTWSLAKSGGQTTVEEIEHALRQVPPGAYRAVRALIEARILRPQKPGTGLVIAPHVLRHVAQASAERLLVAEASPFAWGEGLLRPHAEQSLMENLLSMVLQDDLRPVENVLDLEIAGQPALAAALESCFVCVGLGLLCGQSVPEETLLSLWNEQMQLLVALPQAMPEPRVVGVPDSLKGPVLLRLSTWHLAALAISETLAPGRGTDNRVLRPWHEPDLSEGTIRVLDHLYPLLVSPEVQGQPWAAAAYGLIFRMHVAVKARSVHRLAVPYLLARGVTRGRVNFEAMHDFGSCSAEIDALREASERLTIPWPRLVSGLWQLWASAGRPASANALLAPDATHSHLFWSHLPDSLLGQAWLHWDPRRIPWPYDCLSKAQWQAFAGQFSLLNQLEEPSGCLRLALEKMDGDSIVELSLQAGFNRSSEGTWLLQFAWAKAPAWALAQLQQAAGPAPAIAMGPLLSATPLSHIGQAVEALDKALSTRGTPAQAQAQALHWLRSVVARRAPEWRLAYALLVVVQQRVVRGQTARGPRPD